MNAKLAIPTMIALAAVVALALPSVVAESGYGDYKHTWQDGNYKKHHKVIEVTGFEGTIKITEYADKHALKEQVTVSLSEATAAYPDAKKASMGIAINEDGDKFLVWKVIEKSYDHETHSKTIHVVDAGDKDNTVTVTKQFDKTYKMQKHAQYKEVSEAFDALSQEDRDTLKSHFRDMKGQYHDLSQEQREAKHAEFKQQMETFAELSLQEKISYLQYMAISIRNQA